MDVLFVGLGSIGTRHLKNLHAVAAQKDIPVRAWALRSSARALPEETRALLAGEFTSLPEHARYDAAFITNPTHLHFGMLQNLRGKADTLFIEKPIDLARKQRRKCFSVLLECYLCHTRFVSRFLNIEAACRNGTQKERHTVYAFIIDRMPCIFC